MCDERPRLAQVSSLLDVRAASRAQNEGAKRTKVFKKRNLGESTFLVFTFPLSAFYRPTKDTLLGITMKSSRSFRR